MSATTAKIAAAVAGGYLLGRTKKLKLAITVAGLLAGKKLAADPKAIANRIVDSNPELEHLRGQLTEGLTGAAKELALSTAAARMESMTSALQGTADDVAKPATGSSGSSRSSTAKKAPAKKSSAKKAPAKKSSAKKAPAQKSSTRKSAARKTTAKKSSSGSSSRS